MPEKITVHSVNEFLADVRTHLERERACVWLNVDSQHFTAHRWTPGVEWCDCGQIRAPGWPV